MWLLQKDILQSELHPCQLSVINDGIVSDHKLWVTRMRRVQMMRGASSLI